MKASVYSKKGKKKDEIVLNPEIFAARINERLLELVKNAYAANLRRGTHDTKTHKEVSGGGKKPWKQKGTGRARQGSIRSPQWRGGGIVFGPHPRSYVVNLPNTMRRQALICALSLKGEQKNLLLLEDVKLDSAKTKEWAEIVKSLPLDGKRALCVVKEVDENFNRASRNMSELIQIQRASDVNAFQVLNREKLIIEEAAVAVLENRLTGNGSTAVEGNEAAEAKPKKAARAAAPKKVAAKKAPKAEKKPAKGKGKKS